MKMLKLLLLSFLFSLTQVSLAENYVDLFNLSGYAEGDIPTHLLGEQITVRQEVKDGKIIKFVSGQSDKGKVNYKIPNLAKDFEIILEFAGSEQANDNNLGCCDADIIISFSADNEVKFVFQLGFLVQLGNNAGVNYNDTGWDRKLAANVLKIKIENGNVKTYINSEFFQSMTLEQPNRVYHELLITEIGKDDKIYAMKVNNLGVTTTPSPPPNNTTSTDFETGKQAGIQQCVANPSSCGINVGSNSTNCTTTPSTTNSCIANYATNGELHIPCVNVPGAFGKIETYDVWMQQRAGAFVFDLDLNRIQQR